MSYIGQGLPIDRFAGYVTDSFTGDGSTTAFTLTREPHSESALIVVINNVIQQPTEDYTVSGTTLTIDAAVASGDVIYATHTAGVLPVTESATIDLQGVSDALILDSDADTTISADTDDQIDFKAGGTDIMSLTATTVTINDGTTIITNDNSDTLTLQSADADASEGPVMVFDRASASPADDDVLGAINFRGKDSGGNGVDYVKIQAEIMQESDGSEDGQLQFNLQKAGTSRNVFTLDRVETVFNEDSQDIDFRVESNGNANMLHISGGNDVVGIGAEGDLGVGLHIKSADSGASASAHGDELVIEGSANSGLTVLSGTGSTGSIFFGDSGDNDIGYIQYDHSSDIYYIGTSASTVMSIRDTGAVDINGAGTSSGGSTTAYSLTVRNGQSSNANGIYNYFDGGAPDSNSVYFFVNQDTTTNRCLILASGDIVNHDGDYGTISDERIKQDIRDANSQWDDIKNIKIRNFKKKDDVRQYGDKAWEQIGVIAQELEAVSPKLIRKVPPSTGDIISDSTFGTLYTSDDVETQGDNPTAKVGEIKEIKEQVKAVGSSIIYMKAVKALQEAMAKIETLETKVKALEDA